MVKKQKTKAMITKCYKNRKRISLSYKKEKNYESDIKDNINSD